MKAIVAARRFLMPAAVVSLLCYVRFRAKVSPRAEIELSPNLKIGNGSQVASFCKLKSSDGPLEIGSNTDIATGCFLAANEGGLRIGNDVLIGPNCTIVSNSYIYDDISRPVREQGKRSIGTRIGNNVMLGAGVVVLDGSQIEDGAIVTPNSVVSGHVQSNSIVQGNPARLIFRRR
jgi:galactoside O-acetyltransferase